MAVNRANRALAYHAIDTERDYQEERWGNSRSSNQPGAGERSIDEFAAYVSGYTTTLMQTVATTGSAVGKLEVMRKIAGLCVACFEQHGVPLRDGYNGTLAGRVEVLRRRALARLAAGELSVQVTQDEYTDLVEARQLYSIRAGEDGQPIPTFMDLVLDRLDI